MHLSVFLYFCTRQCTYICHDLVFVYVSRLDLLRHRHPNKYPGGWVLVSSVTSIVQRAWLRQREETLFRDKKKLRSQWNICLLCFNLDVNPCLRVPMHGLILVIILISVI